MILDGCHFEYGSFDSYAYDLIFAHVDTSSFDSMSGSISSQTVFNKRGRNNYLIGDDYSSSPVSFDAEILTCSGLPISESERRYIEKALFNKSRYQKLYVRQQDDADGLLTEIIDDESDNSVKRLYLNCRFINPSRITGNCGETYGYSFTLEADNLMFWQDKITRTFEPVPDEPEVITVDSDIDGYVYPYVRILMGSDGGTVNIVNGADTGGRVTRFSGLEPYTEIIMRGDINYIVPISAYQNFTGRNFVRLVDGDNNILVDGDVESMTIEWNNRRFIV